MSAEAAAMPATSPWPAEATRCGMEIPFFRTSSDGSGRIPARDSAESDGRKAGRPLSSGDRNPCQASDRSGGGHAVAPSVGSGWSAVLKLRPLDPIVTEVPLVLRYDRKQGESKMRV